MFSLCLTHAETYLVNYHFTAFFASFPLTNSFLKVASKALQDTCNLSACKKKKKKKVKAANLLYHQHRYIKNKDLPMIYNVKNLILRQVKRSLLMNYPRVSYNKHLTWIRQSF